MIVGNISLIKLGNNPLKTLTVPFIKKMGMSESGGPCSSIDCYDASEMKKFINCRKINVKNPQFDEVIFQLHRCSGSN